MFSSHNMCSTARRTVHWDTDSLDIKKTCSHMADACHAYVPLKTCPTVPVWYWRYYFVYIHIILYLRPGPGDNTNIKNKGRNRRSLAYTCSVVRCMNCVWRAQGEIYYPGREVLCPLSQTQSCQSLARPVSADRACRLFSSCPFANKN